MLYEYRKDFTLGWVIDRYFELTPANSSLGETARYGTNLWLFHLPDTILPPKV